MAIRFLLVFIVLACIFFILIMCVVLGRWSGRRQLKAAHKHKLEVVTAAETSVFALLGLLIAFTFSGAYGRFENRKIHALEEANAYATALNYVSVVAPKFQPILRDKIKTYINLRLLAYNDLPNLQKVQVDLDAALLEEQQIWHIAVAAGATSPNESLAQSFLAAIDNMFETSRMGMNLIRIHPPAIIFLLMIGLAGLGGYLIGYDAAESKEKRNIHIASYIVLTSLTIYIIINLEFPRSGFIRYSYVDQMTADVRDNTNLAFAKFFPI